MIPAILELHIKGSVFQMDIEFPENQYFVHSREKNFKMNADIREQIVEDAKQTMRINYLRAIIKCGHEYEFHLRVASRANETIKFEQV